MAITYSEAIDANGEPRGRATEAASNLAKSAELASLQTTRSITYLTLNSSLSAIGFWSRLVTAFNIGFLEGQVEIGKRLADILNDRPMKPNARKLGQATAMAAEELAIRADAAIWEAVRKAADDADQVAARIDDAAKGVVAAGDDAVQTIAAVAEDSERAIVSDDGAPELVTTTEGDHEIELRAERLVINKQRLKNGEARVRKQIVTEVQSIEVPVSHEELVIERQAVTEDAQVDGEAIADETIRIPLTEEKVNIAKETFVTEEVEISKRHVDEVEHISDTVRHEELVVTDGAATT